MGIKSFIAAGAMAVISLASAAKATTIDVDLMFVIDRSGSMQTEFNTLGSRIGDVLNGLAGETNTTTGVSVGTVHAGLVTYLSSPTLVQSVTGHIPTLQNAFSSQNASGSTENSNGAVRSVLPTGSLFGSAGWREGTVKSVILITDEDSDINTDYAITGTLLDNASYFNNVITLQGLYDTYEDMARPTSGLFDLDLFRNDASTFLTGFINTKLEELTTGGTPTGGSNVIPLPAAGWMLLAGIGGLGVLRRRQKQAAT